ncbi:hypothetical protein ACFYYY_22485 [Streptomyces sp. NPDC001834]|uniref:hypothetical protein n=1 Tax=Streptomyces sp. NPDC001834 TaxID=3364616 RepID=UPI00367D6B2B
MGLLLVVAVTSASVQDRAGGRAVLARLAVGFRAVGLGWADGGYANSVDCALLSWTRPPPRRRRRPAPPGPVAAPVAPSRR